MYIRPPKKRRSSPVRVLILLVLIAAGVYLLVFRRDEYLAWGRGLLPAIQVGPTPTPTPSADDIMALARQAYRDGLLDQALLKYGEAAAVEPENPTPYVWSSLLLALRQRTAESVEKARQAVGLAPDSAEALAALCMALDWNAEGDQSKLQEALNACLSAVELDPTYAEAHAYLAEVYADLGQTKQAGEMARLAVTLDNSSVLAHRDLGYALEKQKKYREAVAEYQRAAQLYPRLAQPWVDLGRIHANNNHYSEALAAYEKATVVDPQSAHALDQLGWAYHANGEYQRAVVVLKKAVEIDPKYGPAFGHLGRTYYQLRDWEDAIPAFRTAIDLGATQLEYYYLLGLAYAFLDRCDEARPWLLQALERDPTFGPAKEGLALCPKK
jgi:tetratricopeptide (TPR) repeat protein